MKVYQKCSDCNSQISIWTWEQDKFGLIRKYGDKIELKCKECSKSDSYFCNDFKAKKSKIAILIAAIIFFVGTPILLILLWNTIWNTALYGTIGFLFVVLIPVIVFRIINTNENNRVRNFNHS